jgi:hypothetical protein
VGQDKFARWLLVRLTFLFLEINFGNKITAISSH